MLSLGWASIPSRPAPRWTPTCPGGHRWGIPVDKFRDHVLVAGQGNAVNENYACVTRRYACLHSLTFEQVALPLVRCLVFPERLVPDPVPWVVHLYVSFRLPCRW